MFSVYQIDSDSRLAGQYGMCQFVEPYLPSDPARRLKEPSIKLINGNYYILQMVFQVGSRRSLGMKNEGLYGDENDEKSESQF